MKLLASTLFLLFTASLDLLLEPQVVVAESAVPSNNKNQAELGQHSASSAASSFFFRSGRNLQSCSNCCNSNADCADRGDFFVCQNPPNGNCNRLPVPSGGGGCFSQDSTVQVWNVGSTKMKDLSIGDYILTAAAGGNGYHHYEPIYAFGHLDRNVLVDFLEIEAISKSSKIDTNLKNHTKSTLRVTGDHLIRIKGGAFVPVQSIRVGDILEEGVVVTKVQPIQDVGLYAPLTASGLLIVDGFTTSTYVSLQEGNPKNLRVAGFDTHVSQHWFSHIAMSPIRVLCGGISPAFCSNDMIDDTGYAWYTQLGYLVADYAAGSQPAQHATTLPSSIFKIIFLCLFGVLCLVVYAFECAVGATSSGVLSTITSMAFTGGIVRYLCVNKQKS